MIVHVIWCQGCGHAWCEVEAAAVIFPHPLAAAGACTCTCTDPGDPLYEAWIIDPDPGEVPAPAFAAWESWALRMARAAIASASLPGMN